MAMRTRRQKLAPRDASSRLKEIEACKLRAQGLSYAEIAAQVGYSDRGAAYRAIHRSLAERKEEAVEELRREEGNLLDRLQREVWHEYQKAVTQQQKLHCIDRLLSISDRRCALYGLKVKPENVQAQVIIREVREAREVEQQDGTGGP